MPLLDAERDIADGERRAVALGDIRDFDIHRVLSQAVIPEAAAGGYPGFTMQRVKRFHGSRLSLRSAGMTTKPYDTKICAIFSIQPGRSLFT